MHRNNPFLAVDRLLVGDMYTSSAVMDVLEVLCDDFGSRFAGTPEERRAATYIAETFREYGLENVRLESYDYAGWSRGPAAIEVLDPPSPRRLRCISLPYSPARVVRGELVDVGFGTPDEFARVGDRLAGRIAMVQSASPASFGRWIHRTEKYDRAVLAGAAGFVFVSEYPGAGPETGSLRNDGEAPIPGISISFEEGAYLQRLAGRYGRVHLEIRTTDVNRPATSWNVVGELPGARHPEEWILVGSHYDGHDIAQGALDPASGTATVIECARVLAAHGRDLLGRGIQFIAWGTEEIGLIGAYRHVERHREELDRFRFCFNLDSAGAGRPPGVVLHRWPELEPFFTDAVAAMAAEAPVGQNLHGYSDHLPYFLEGIPTAHMGDPFAAPAGRGFGHTMFDTLDKVKLSDLRQAASVAARLLLRLAAVDPFPAARRSPEVMADLIATDPDLVGYRVARELEARMDHV